jgi:ABC-type polysaccharide/polyol phosphate export permease
MRKSNENTWELIMMLAKTDFKLKYQGSILGYFWAIIKPLLLFIVLNTVFSFVFDLKNFSIPFYSLQLLTAILLFNFFSEGTSSGMHALVGKTQLVTKIYIPRWTIIFASTLNTFFIFCANLFVLVLFFIYFWNIPSIQGIIFFGLLIVLLYVLIFSFSLVASTLFARFRDSAMIWEVLLMVIMYTSPIIYPLSFIPENVRGLFMLNPVGFIIHYAKIGLVSNTFPKASSVVFFILGCGIILAISIFIFNKLEKKVAEHL